MPEPTTGGPLTTDATAPLTPAQQARAEDAPPSPPERSPYEIVPPDDLVGVRAIGVMLRDLPFPLDLADVRERAGGWRVPVTGAHYHPLAQFLEGVPDRSYRSAEALVRAIEKAHRDLAP
jgi:hypothetical protein